MKVTKRPTTTPPQLAFKSDRIVLFKDMLELIPENLFPQQLIHSPDTTIVQTGTNVSHEKVLGIMQSIVHLTASSQVRALCPGSLFKQLPETMGEFNLLLTNVFGIKDDQFEELLDTERDPDLKASRKTLKCWWGHEIYINSPLGIHFLLDFVDSRVNGSLDIFLPLLER
ncbi:MAG: hypothetical protein HQ564_10450 [Candidatus Saganbacteria bacterium]|nr:hypothetical protein [Candidatus Saganbacteria bacterium]